MTPETCESLISFFGPNMIIINIDALPRAETESGMPRGRTHRPHLRGPGSSLLLVFLWRSVQDLRLYRLEFDSAGSPASC